MHQGFNILQAGEVVKEHGCYPARIVLRDLGETSYDRFVVHMQVFPPDRPPFFVTGDYTKDLADAVKRFTERDDALTARHAIAAWNRRFT